MTAFFLSDIWIHLSLTSSQWVDEDEQNDAPDDDYMNNFNGGGMPGMGGMGGPDGGLGGIDFSKLGGGDDGDAMPDMDDEGDEGEDSDDEMPEPSEDAGTKEGDKTSAEKGKEKKIEEVA